MTREEVHSPIDEILDEYGQAMQQPIYAHKFTKQAQTATDTKERQQPFDFELGYIGTEHLLLGLLSETEGAAGRVLEEFQVDGKKLVELIDKLVTPC